tara:strand:- start:1372 stop:1635 length:264 start_codon:yes stop_codon:yes gene_type:complete
MKTVTLTAGSAALLEQFRNDSIDDDNTGTGWLGLFDDELTAAQKGHLTDLKKKGLVVNTGSRDRNDNGWHTWQEVDLTTQVNVARDN